MANGRPLTASNIRYLLTMRELNTDGQGVRCRDMAAALGLTSPSVHNMMDTFVEMGLIDKGTSGVAFFTDEGADAARRYARYYRAVAQLLTASFPGAERVQAAACSLLAELPEECLEALCNQTTEIRR